MSMVAILASVFALAVGTVGCGNSQGQSNSLVDVGPSMVSSTPSEEGGGNLTTLAKGGGGGRKGGGTPTTGGGTLSVVLFTDANGNGVISRGDTITYNVSTSAPYPTVDLTCKQNGAVVLSAQTGFYEGYPWPSTNYMTLSSGAWPSGTASDCTATLHSMGSTTVLAQVNFSAGA